MQPDMPPDVVLPTVDVVALVAVPPLPTLRACTEQARGAAKAVLATAVHGQLVLVLEHLHPFVVLLFLPMLLLGSVSGLGGGYRQSHPTLAWAPAKGHDAV